MSGAAAHDHLLERLKVDRAAACSEHARHRATNELLDVRFRRRAVEGFEDLTELKLADLAVAIFVEQLECAFQLVLSQ